MSLGIVDWTPPSVTVEVKCGRGFYMRSLAHDLGSALGCGAHLKALTRTRSGPFELSDALSLDDVDRVFSDGSWNEVLHSPDIVVRSLRAVVVGERIEKMLKNGRPFPPGTGIPYSKPYEKCRVYAEDGRFLAIVAFNPSPRSMGAGARTQSGQRSRPVAAVRSNRDPGGQTGPQSHLLRSIKTQIYLLRT